MHTITVAGRLGRDPELRYTSEGVSVASFSVADNGQDGVTWFNVTVWRQLAESCAEYLSKGREVALNGYLKAGEGGGPRVWTGRDGEARASFEVVAYRVEFMGGAEAQGEAGDDSVPF